MLGWLLEILIGYWILKWFFGFLNKMTNDSNAIIRLIGYAIMISVIIHIAEWFMGVIF